MKRWILPVLLLGALLSPIAHGTDKPTVVVTFSILEDFAQAVAGEHAEVVSLAPRGAEVHEYELRPADFQALEDADLVFYNGLNLEQWMGQLRATVTDGVPVVSLAEESGVDTLPIVTGDFAGDGDPHVWMDPRKVRNYVDVIRQRLTELVPEQEQVFQANAGAYINELRALYQDMTEELAAIPEERRTLITSEAAFIYFADAFDFHHDGIWGTNSETEGTSRQLMRIMDIIKERQPPAIFWESTISSRHVESVSGDTGVPYYGPLHVDSLTDEDGKADTYLNMMRENVRVLKEALHDDG